MLPVVVARSFCIGIATIEHWGPVHHSALSAAWIFWNGTKERVVSICLNTVLTEWRSLC